jgi:hypothetical protein
MAKKKTTPKPDDDNLDFVRKAIAKYEKAFDRERANIALAMEDLEFRVGEQWPSGVKAERERDYRPALTINKIPTYVRKITGSIRAGRPSIRVEPVDSRGDPDTAETLEGLIRYIENRSDAQHAYTAGADSQVVAGIGHWRVLTEYADDSTFNQEIRIATVADGVNVIWDPDSVYANKEDARFCFVPVDLSHDEFEEKYPDAPIDDFNLSFEGHPTYLDEWYGDDLVRVAEYWERRLEKRTLAMLPNGAIDDVTEQPERLAELKANGARIEERESHCVYRSVISSCHLLEEPVKWPGRYIPVVPVIGEEVTCGRRKVRHGIVRYLKDPQRAYNYFRSAETEAVALQPKAPFMVTEKNVQDNEDMWLTANLRNHPYLLYTPDPKNGNAPPQRINARMDTAGMVEGLTLSSQEMMDVTGIHEASLGQSSNETSGKAIMARQQESDVGSYVYVQNFSRAIKHTGRILLDLIPHIYDAERTIRITGEDGKVDLVDINQQSMAIDTVLNDVTVAAYDVHLDQGPSFATKREEAREGMLTFMQQAPSAAPVVLDLIANAQDWPNADKFAKRLKTLLPPNIQAMEAQESGEAPPPPPPPDPEVLMKQAELQSQQMEMQFGQAKLQAEAQKAQLGLKEQEMNLQQKQMDLRLKAMEVQGIEPNEQLVQMLGTLQQTLAMLLQQINSPKSVIRGSDGKIAGVESNGQIRTVHRDANGRVATIQ